MINTEESAEFKLCYKDLIVWAHQTTCRPCSSNKPKKRSNDDLTNIDNDYNDDDDKSGEDLTQGSEHNINITQEELESNVNNNGDKAILKNISGKIESGKMTAIIGPSGSGKTTLMNFLSSRSTWAPDLYIDGELYLNNTLLKNLSKFKHIIGYVSQEDILINSISIKENLLTYAKLRGLRNSKERIGSIIDDLGLEKCQDTVVGTDMERGISGGEKKRTSIGVELVSDPKILFLDEPTTGLDAFTALEIMKKLKRLNRVSELGVVAVIHQPRQEIMELFDQVSVYI